MENLITFFCALIGVCLQAFVKISSINDRTPPEVQIRVIIGQYFRSDFAKIAISLLCIPVWMIGFQIISIIDPTVNLPFNWGPVGKYQYALGVCENFIIPFLAFFSSTLVFKGKTKGETLINEKLA